MQISMKAAFAGVLVPLAIAGTCLACAPATAWADAAQAAESVVAAGAEAPGQAGAEQPDEQGVFADGVLTFAGLKVTLPQDMQVRTAGTLASAANEEGTLTASVENLSFATLPEDADVAAAFKEAANKTVSDYATASVTDKGTVALAEGVTGYVYELDVTGPYMSVKNADGTTTASQVGPEGHWTVTQVYVALKDGGFALAQVAVSETAGDEDVAAAKAAVASIALADEKADEDVAAKADDGRATAGGFTFALPEGLREAEEGAVWLGTTDNVLVESTGTLVEAADAKTLDEAGVKALFEAAAQGMGATFEGFSAVKAGEVELTVGVFALTSGTQTYECLMVLVPVADGSVEGLTAVCDPAASKSWADKLGTLVASIEVTPAAGK